ncbi:response regulator [Haloflavibacter putidus]|uniref:Response regulator n=1 Tax=Haloflavibacter putidus TaxID=2576776 RepID=A0A507ZS16_9FLAO|nr:response regulator [Haloflavibacter putidus]TQD38508.1 response regulator [Haloflavibacter putidus]
MRVCIIDDDKIYQLLIKKMFKMLNGHVKLKSLLDGQEALQHFTEDKPTYDIVLVDLNMPRINGWELLKEMQDKNILPNAHVYIATSSIDYQDQKKAKDYEIVKGILTKPITKEKLEQLIF